MQKKLQYFSDIKLEILNGTLHIEVTENRMIQSLQINGIKTKRNTELINELINKLITPLIID